MRFYYTPRFIQKLLPGFTWRKTATFNTIYLTFDDGPIPEVTEFVLHALERHQAKATFFCVGENIYRHQHIARSIKAAGHTLGNHTYNHLKGWQTITTEYVDNTRRCQDQLAELQ